MKPRAIALIAFFACGFVPSSRAQFPNTKPAPLLPGQGNSSAAGCSTSEASACAQVAAKITPIILGASPLDENLRHLTDDIGGRVTGTPRMDQAVDWAIAAFRSAGVDVRTEKYQLPTTWSEGDTKLELLGPVQFPVTLVSTGWSPATPAGGIEAHLIDIGYGTPEAFAKSGGTLNGAILLVHSNIGSTWADLFDEYNKPPAIIDRALKNGAVAILWTGARERKLMYRHINAMNGKPDVIPQAVVAREDAMRLSREIAANNGKLRVRFHMTNKFGGPVEQANVIGEIRGYEKPDEVVILGAHLDSWELGTGALDNGCNAALVIEAARALKASGLLPRRTIRFILFSGEEQGMLGSEAYVKAHKNELDKVRAMVVFDTGIGRVTGYSLGGRSDIEPAVREVLAPFADWDVNHHTNDFSIGTDNFDFMLEGIPTLMANQEIANYLANYHAASDTLDKVDMRELKLNTILAAVTTWGIADRLEPIGKRFNRAETEELLHETGGDEQLKVLGYWQDWQSGARGLHP